MPDETRLFARRKNKKGAVLWHDAREHGVSKSITSGVTEGMTCPTHESCANPVTRRPQATANLDKAPRPLARKQNRRRSAGLVISVNARVRRDATESICEQGVQGNTANRSPQFKLSAIDEIDAGLQEELNMVEQDAPADADKRRR